MNRKLGRFRFLILMVLLPFYTAPTQADSSIEKAGDVLAILIPGIGLGSTLFYEHGYEGTIQFAKSAATSGLVTEGLKKITHKRRPNGDCCDSFPSGHTSAAFMGAAFIHKRYGLREAILPYIGATFVGYSRVHADKHFVEDVIGGAAIGIASSFYFTKPYKGFTVTPVVEKDGLTVSFSRNW